MGKRSKGARQEKQDRQQKAIDDLVEKCKEFDTPESGRFSDLPLSKQTQSALEQNGYTHMTDIQKKALVFALKGKDVLGAAKTGSGKTLCFLIPILETLYKQSWSNIFGLGALAITPTRELAYQIFEVLRKIGSKHFLSAGLIIGGKDLKTEQEIISTMAILICTPGRLLQHMDETPNFDCSSLQILVLDEADRILDLGFEKTLNAIIDHLPVTRQTLLFSATQTKSINDLARLSLKNPEYVSVHANAITVTPQKLHQNYVICELENKLSILFSFIRTHAKMKMIIFVSSCKQVRFIYETFKRMRSGVQLLELHGGQKQLKRMGIYNDFCKKSSAVLIATDIAARGLDFPEVSWVVQVDCPEDTNTYIHRVGRTARLDTKGNALLMLLPSETKAVTLLEESKIPITEIQINPEKIKSISQDLAGLCAEHADVKHLAQKYFVSYTRSVFLQKNKDIFDVHALPLDKFALCLGLSQPPKVRFMKKSGKKNSQRDAEKQMKAMEEDLLKRKKAKTPNKNVEEANDSDDSDDSDSDSDIDDKLKETKGKMNFNSLADSDDDSDDDDDLLVSKGRNPYENIADLTEAEIKALEKKQNKGKYATKKNEAVASGLVGTKILFNSDDEKSESSGEDSDGINVEKRRKAMTKIDKEDKQKDRERVKAKHKERAQKRKLKNKEESGMNEGAVLEPYDGDGEDLYLGHSDDDGENSDEDDEDEINKINKAKRAPRSLEDDEQLALSLLGI